MAEKMERVSIFLGLVLDIETLHMSLR